MNELPPQGERRESPRQLLDRMRGVLRGIANSSEENEEATKTLTKEQLTRREALKRLSYAAVGAAAVVGGVKVMESVVEYNKEQEVIQQRSDEFLAEVGGYEAQTKLRFDEVLFVDQTGAPITYVTMEDFTIERDGEPYLLSPGKRDEYGIIEGDIPGEWLDYVRGLLKDLKPEIFIDLEADVPRALSVHGQFRAALNDPDEPNLADKIRTGQVTTYEGIVQYFSEKPVVGAENFTRREYVESQIQFRTWEEVEGEMVGVHPAAQDEMRRLIVGLCAQESNFNNGLVSASDARGIFQILLEVWQKDYELAVDDFKSLKTQIEVAGKHLSRMYARMQDKAGELAMQQLRTVHADEEMLQVEVLVPLTLNSYNAGPDRVGEAVRKYFELPANRDKRLTGRDLFLDIANFADERKDGLLAGYGEHAREYVPRIYAKANIFKNE